MSSILTTDCGPALDAHIARWASARLPANLNDNVARRATTVSTTRTEDDTTASAAFLASAGENFNATGDATGARSSATNQAHTAGQRALAGHSTVVSTSSSNFNLPTITASNTKPTANGDGATGA
jgi:hypothetical protein